MPAKPLDRSVLTEAVSAWKKHGSKRAAAEALGIPRQTLKHRLDLAHRAGVGGITAPSGLVYPIPPDAEITLAELLARRREQSVRRGEVIEAARLLPVRVPLPGPIGLAIIGDPHLDSPDCDFAALERDLKLVAETPAMYASNLGDVADNWTGRLAGLYAHSSVTRDETVRLIDWFVGAAPWLVFLLGNHCVWNNQGELLRHMAASVGVPAPEWTARVALHFPNGREYRISHKHGFNGHSLWNAGHGTLRAAYIEARDHLYTGGHLHQAWVQGPRVDPNTEEWAWMVQVGSYKRNGTEVFSRRCPKPEQNAFPAAAVVINPDATTARGLARVFTCIAEAADFLKWFRRRKRVAS
jgi:hypothetical protein